MVYWIFKESNDAVNHLIQIGFHLFVSAFGC